MARKISAAPVVQFPADPTVLLTPLQAAAFLGGISVKTLFRMIRRREISYVKVSQKIFRFERAAIDVFIAKRRTRSAA